MHFLTDHLSIVEPANLGQEQALETLRQAARYVRPAACIALYGTWGAGKTTLLRSLYHSWNIQPDGSKQKKGLAIWFDPWLFERSGDVVTPLITEITRVITEQVPAANNDAFWKTAMDLAKVLGAMALRVSLAIAGGKEGFKDGLKALGKEKPISNYKALQAQHADVIAAREAFRKIVAFAAPNPDDRVLICLDDLDRCLPESVVTLIEAIKLVLCGLDTPTGTKRGPGEVCKAVFVFALDRTLVGEAIRKQYGGASLYVGENYLEKIFDLSIEAPPIDVQSLANHVSRHIGDGANAFAAAFGVAEIGTLGTINLAKTRLEQAIRKTRLNNPRVVKRAFNRISLLVAADARAQWIAKRCADDENAVRFLCWVLGIERLRNFRHFFANASDDELQQLVACVNGESVADANPTVHHLVNTPGFRAFFGALEREKWVPERRITSSGKPTLGDFDQLLRRAGL